MIIGFTYKLSEWQISLCIHIVDDDSLNVLFNFIVQNPYCLGAEISQGEDETWSVSFDHDYDDAEEEEEEPNDPPDYYLYGNEEDDELSYADSYSVIPIPIVAGFEGEFYKGHIFHSKQVVQVAIKYHTLSRMKIVLGWCDMDVEMLEANGQ
ncbi:unnamed protein product [Linum trigynum]|uniref:Uncharacterized protein n=1 Tax=Linum trigynum TaxID=586398 RepID=A0AAV2EA61_9ROSI